MVEPLAARACVLIKEPAEVKATAGLNRPAAGAFLAAAVGFLAIAVANETRVASTYNNSLVN